VVVWYDELKFKEKKEMTKPFRQPLHKRIQDICVFGVILLIMSILSGTLKILMFTVPTFLILAFILATGRYTEGKGREKTYLELQQESNKRIFSGCKNFYNRKQVLGY